jgi:hypothetical protein
MPIQFPRPSGSTNLFAERTWLRLATKAFDVVPAPSISRVGYSFNNLQTNSGYALDPGLSVRRATNVRRFSTMYQAPTQTAVVNQASPISQIFDETNSFDRDLGQQNERITGISYDKFGAVLGGCEVKVFREADDVLVATTTSDGSGNWTAYPNQPGPYYFRERKAGAPNVFGTSDNGKTSTQFTPGQ